MKEKKSHTGLKIRMILYLMPVVILFFLVIISKAFSIDIVLVSDLANWATLVVEIGIGVTISLTILIYSNAQQKKFREQQDKISDLVTEVKNLTEEQKKIREGRHRWALVLLRFELENLKTLLDEDPYQDINLDVKRLAKNIEQIVNQSGDVIEPDFTHDFNKICETIHENTDGKKMIVQDIFSDPELLNFVNYLISRIEKIYPSI